MRTVRIFAVISLILFIGSPVFAQGQLDDPKVARAKYDELAAKVNSGDLKVDWRALRLAARVGEIAGGYDLLAANRRAIASYQKGDNEEALKTAREVEQHSIADGQAHLTAMNSLIVLGRQHEADKERGILQALLESITKSGDGKSAKTAWFAVGIQEEYVYMYALQVEFKQQHSLQQDSHWYDAVLVTDKSGKDKVLWFNTDTDIALLNRAGTEGATSISPR
jgi:hypothetical protein